MTTPRPIALGFTEGITPLEELQQRIAAGHHNYAIMLAGGVAISRKTIRLDATETRSWTIINEIDDSEQHLDARHLWTESNIGEALDKRALLDMDGDDGILTVAGRGIVKADDLLAEMRAEIVPDANDDPLAFRLTNAPGAIRLDDSHGEEGEWEPADPSLLLEACDIGPATVAQIDLAAHALFPENGTHIGAATSIELTIEDIDALIATLAALREDAITNRGFALRSSGYWTNGIEGDE